MAKQSTKKSGKKSTQKVDFEPNKMGFAVAILGTVTLLLLAVIVTQT